jgi:hypothetical protein
MVLFFKNVDKMSLLQLLNSSEIKNGITIPMELLHVSIGSYHNAQVSMFIHSVHESHNKCMFV